MRTIEIGKGGVLLFENLGDKELIESFQQSIELNLDHDFINLLGQALLKRGFAEVVEKELVK